MTQLTYKLSPAASTDRSILGETGPKITNFTVGQTPDGEMVYTIKFKFPKIGSRGESGFATLRLDEPLPGLLEWRSVGTGDNKVFRHKTGVETPALQLAAKKMLVAVGKKPDGKAYYECEILGFSADARVKAWGNFVNSPVKKMSSLILDDDDDEQPSDDDIDI